MKELIKAHKHLQKAKRLLLESVIKFEKTIKNDKNLVRKCRKWKNSLRS